MTVFRNLTRSRNPRQLQLSGPVEILPSGALSWPARVFLSADKRKSPGSSRTTGQSTLNKAKNVQSQVASSNGQATALVNAGRREEPGPAGFRLRWSCPRGRFRTSGSHAPRHMLPLPVPAPLYITTGDERKHPDRGICASRFCTGGEVVAIGATDADTTQADRRGVSAHALCYPGCPCYVGTKLPVQPAEATLEGDHEVELGPASEIAVVSFPVGLRVV